MATEIQDNPLPSKAVLTASFHEVRNPVDPVPANDLPLPDEYPYLRLGITHKHKTMFFPSEVVSGPVEQVVSLSPGETVEVTMEVTRRITVEDENESRSQVTSEASQEQSFQDEFTDRVANVLTDTHSTSVSVNASGSIAVISGSVGITDTYTSTQTQSREQTRQTMRQSTQRVSQQLMKSFVIRSKRTEDTSTRDTFRRLLRNESTQPLHFGFRKTLQKYRAVTQYMGPQLVWHVAIENPGVGLGGPRVVGPRMQPGSFLQQAMRMMLLTEYQGFGVPYEPSKGTVYDIAVPLLNYDERFVGALFLNGRNSVEFNTITPTYSMNFLCVIEKTEPQGNGTVKIRFRPTILSSSGNVPAAISITLPPFHLLSVNQKTLVATDPGQTPIEDFLNSYRDFLTESTSLEARPAGDLRQEERSELLRRALVGFQFAPKYSRVRQEEIRLFDDLFDTRSAFYNLYPPHYNSLGASYRAVGAGGISEYDTFKGLPAAPYGSSLAWKIQLDADARRTEFINSPLARVSIPIVAGREAEAIAFLLQNLRFRLSKNSTDLVSAISKRRTLERHLADLGRSEMDVDLRARSEKIDEDTATDEKLAVALYPVTEVFDVTEPLTGFLYEPIEP